MRPDRNRSGKQLVEVFRREVKAALPSQCGPFVEVEGSEFSGIAELRRDLLFADGVAQIDDAGKTIAEFDGDEVFLHMSCAFDGDHFQANGSILWNSLLPRICRSSA